MEYQGSDCSILYMFPPIFHVHYMTPTEHMNAPWGCSVKNYLKPFEAKWSLYVPPALAR
jgi:hypothetical protein